MAMVQWRRGDVVLGLYEVLDVLESGGMGLVYRVRHRSWSTDLAVKVPRPELVATSAGGSGFEREAGTWVGLGPHPNVVACLYVRRVEDVPCVFAEWVGGGSLAELVRDKRLYVRNDGERNNGHLADGDRDGEDRDDRTARVLDLAVQIAWGIDHAHRQGLIHQDVKPANIMVDVDADWTAKVTDFGLAGARAAAGESSVAPPEGSLLASYGGMTPAYCSPEQADALSGARVALTRATDVWSWALCVLEMFVGGPPCRFGQSAPEVFDVFLKWGQPAPGAPAVPPALADLLWRCFEVDPVRRPQRLDEVAAAVAQIYADVVGTPYPRVAPQAAGLLADGLSNQALSLFDLDRVEEAEALWRDARDIDPHHLPTVYNQALHRWRQASLSDEDVVSELRTAKALQGGPALDADRLLGLVQVERGDDEAARALLADASDGPEARSAREELARRGPFREPQRLEGHGGAVRAVALSADGEVALTGGADGRVRVWEPAAHRCRYELPREAPEAPEARGALGAEAPDTDNAPVPVVAVAISPDGRTGLAGHRYGPVELWDLTSGTLLGTLGAHGPEVTSVALNGSGGAAVAYATGRVDVWDARGGRLLRTLEHPPSSYQKLDPATGRVLPEIHQRPAKVPVLALSADGGVAVSAAPDDGSVVAWDVAGARPLHRLVKSADMHNTGIDRVALSPDGRYALLTGFQTDAARIWECATDRIRATVPDQIGNHVRVALNGDATVAASIPKDGNEQPLRIWDLGSGRCLRTIGTRLLPDPMPGFTAPLPLTCVALSGDARVAVLGDQYGGIQIHHLPPGGFRAAWHYARPRTAAALAQRETEVERIVERAEALADQGNAVAAAEQLRAARAVPGFERHPGLRRLWEEMGRAAGRRTDLLSIWQRYDLSGRQALGQQATLALTPDGELAVIPGAFGRVRVWELQTGQHLHTFPERVANTHTVLVAEDGRLAVTADWEGTAHLWDLESGTRRCQLYGDNGSVKAIAMDRAGRHALVGDEDGALCLWRLHTADRGRTMVAHEGPVALVRLTPDARYAASAGLQDRTGRLWDTRTGRPLLTFPLELGNPELRFAPDGGRLFVSTGLRLSAWDVRSRRLLYEREAYPEGFTLSADGRVAATCGIGTVQVWETQTGRTVCELPARASVFDVSPDGRHVVTAADRVLHVWDVRTGQRAHTLEGHPASVCLLMFGTDGRNLVSADYRPGIRLWELDYDYDFTPEGAGDR
ncbi:protein kinase [Streptomyces sp. NPDC001315]|uniref:WD40 repeat domain-containing serine/threonine protein kinase n=1 Tax=Streptomyces sp. NPDC001315 TaxID=3364562 RepID=UPI003686B0EF